MLTHDSAKIFGFRAHATGRAVYAHQQSVRFVCGTRLSAIAHVLLQDYLLHDDRHC